MQLTQSHLVINSPMEFDAIGDPDIQLVIWRRTVSSLLLDWLEQPLPDGLNREARLKGEVRLKGGPAPWQEFLSGFPDGAGGDAFRDDLLLQADSLAHVFPEAAFHLKLQRVANNLCERFHTDSVPLRLLCTYVGPAAEWIDHADVERAPRHPIQADARAAPPLLRPGGRVNQLLRFDVALMKGNRWPGNEGNGLVHRSPRLDSSTPARLLFKIDVEF